MDIKPIAYFRSPFPGKFGIPRQAGLAPDLRGQIVFEPEFRSADALRGLEGFDYIWLIWEFSWRKTNPSTPRRPLGGLRGVPLRLPASLRSEPLELAPAERFRATIRPPRLGGNQRVGVFASRSPFRPNRLGLSSVLLESIDYEAKGPDGKPLGPVINVLGADLMDLTPIYDIKPYVEYSDSHPGARSGFVDSAAWEPLEVIIPESARGDKIDLEALKEVLALDPRPRYHDDPSREYGMSFSGKEVRFKVEGRVMTVLSISEP